MNGFFLTGTPTTRGIVLLVVAVLFATGWFLLRDRPALRDRLLRSAWLAYAAAQGAFLFLLLAAHLRHPAYLETLEGTILQHVQRLRGGLPVYPAPSPDFVALAYNPGFYVLSLPFTWLLGTKLAALRLLSSLGFLGAAALVGLAVRRETGQRWLGFAAAGLFVGGYRALDAALDGARPDSLLLFFALAGTWIAARGRSRAAGCGAVALWCVAFWCKQAGAPLALGGTAILIARDGWKKGLWYAAVLAALGVLPYLLAGKILFGSHFLYFTYQVPAAWTELTPAALTRLARYFARYWPLFFVAAVSALLRSFRRRGLGGTSPWIATLPFAWASALLGALDPGSSDNVFILGATWTLIAGVSEIGGMLRGPAPGRGREALAGAMLLFSAVSLLYDPREVLVPRSATRATRAFAAMVDSLGAATYVPQFGAVPGVARLDTEANWVALEDLGRGPGRVASGDPEVRRLLAPVETGSGSIVTHWKMTDDTVLGPLATRFEPPRDLGLRFAAMRTLPHRFGAPFPRYLYIRRGAREGAEGGAPRAREDLLQPAARMRAGR